MSVYEGQSYVNTPEPTLRKISSVVVSERYLDEESRKDIVKYVEVPIIEERVKQVTRHEVIEVEKRVPKYEYRYVDKTVEVPQIQYQDRIVEVPQIREEIKYVPKHEYVERPIEVIEHVPKIERRVVEKIVDVPGQVVEVPKPYRVDQDVPVPNYTYSKKNILVAQTLRPEFVLGEETVPVEMIEYVPDYMEVEIPIPKLVDIPIRARGMVDQYYYPVDVPPPQYNSIIKNLNPSVQRTDHHALPFIYQDGRLPELSPEYAHKFLEIPEDIEIIHDKRYFNGPPLRYVQSVPAPGFPSYDGRYSSQVLNNAAPLLFSPSRPTTTDRDGGKGSSRRKHRRRKH